MMCSMRCSPALSEVGAVAHALDNSAMLAIIHGFMVTNCIYWISLWFVLAQQTRSLSKRDFRAHHTGTLVSRRDLHDITSLAAHYPFAFGAIIRHEVIGPERHAGMLVRLAFELTGIDATLALHQTCVLRQR